MISRFDANSEKCCKYMFLGESAQIITILQRGGYRNLLQYYKGGGLPNLLQYYKGGVSWDPKFVLRNIWTAPNTQQKHRNPKRNSWQWWLWSVSRGRLSKTWCHGLCAGLRQGTRVGKRLFKLQKKMWRHLIQSWHLKKVSIVAQWYNVFSKQTQLGIDSIFLAHVICYLQVHFDFNHFNHISKTPCAEFKFVTLTRLFWSKICPLFQLWGGVWCHGLAAVSTSYALLCTLHPFSQSSSASAFTSASSSWW